MIRRWMLLLLVAVLIGCGSDSKSESDSDSGGKEKQTAAADPGKKQEKIGKTSDARDSKTPASESSSNSRVLTGGNSTDSVDVRDGDMNKLKSVALSMHNYEAVRRKFPMASTGDGRVSKDLSWRVLVLPYLEFNDEYNKFDVSQSWDSAKNKPLVDSQAKEAFELGNGKLICAIKHDEQPKTLREISDGSSNTIAFMESPAVDASKWTTPVDIEAKDGVKLIKSLKKGEFLLVALYDGSVCKVYSPDGKNLKDEEIAALFGYRDGTPINRDVFLPSK